jgi:tight adherence protein B
MSENVIEIGVYVCVFSAAFFLAFSFFDELGRTANDIQEKQNENEIGSTLSELCLSLSPQTFLSIRILASVLAFLFGFLLLDIFVGLLFAVIGFAIPKMMLLNMREKRLLLLEEQLIEGLELLKNGLKSGLTIQQASELLVKEFPDPISKEFSIVLAENRLGIDFIDGLENMAVRLNSTAVQILASGVAITKQCGGDLGQIFGNLAETIREQSRIDGKLKAVTSQGRFQGLILGLMPFALLIALYFVDQQHVKTLFGHQIGIYAFVGVIGMVIVAQLWIRKLMDIDV